MPVSQRIVVGLAIAALLIAAVGVGYAIFRMKALRPGPGTKPIVKEFSVSSDFVIGSNRFTPSTITVFQGDHIHIEVANRGEIVHSFTSFKPL